MLSRHCAIGLVFTCMVLAWSDPGLSQTFIQAQKLDFGRWFISEDSVPVTITVSPTGTVSSSDPTAVMFVAPKPGVYTITGLPPFTTFNAVNVTVNTPVEFGGISFTMDNFTTQIPDADGSGVTVLRLGADIETLGGGQTYAAGVYNGLIDIELDY